MKNLNKILTVLILASGSTVFAQNKANLNVTITNIESDEGKVVVSLFNSKETFLGKHYRQQVVSAKSGSISFDFKDLPNGDYTISAYQDKNKNGELDKNFIGIPMEPYGISMDGKSNFGPPNYQNSMFTIDGNSKKLSIKI